MAISSCIKNVGQRAIFSGLATLLTSGAFACSPAADDPEKKPGAGAPSSNTGGAGYDGAGGGSASGGNGNGNAGGSGATGNGSGGSGIGTGGSGAVQFDFDPADTMPASFAPPGGLSVDEVPLFVVFGFDDNRHADGMKWVLDTFSGKNNPAGNGNSKTYDGQPITVSFYHTTNSLDAGGAALLEQWQRAVKAGHEVANHTHTHKDIPVESDWVQEITLSNSILAQELNISEKEIVGIRAPFLSFDAALFTAIKEKGLLYDCSVTHTPDDWENHQHIWPYTLEDGLHQRTSFQPLGKYPGVWEVPVYTMPRSGPDRKTSANQPMAGFDSTAYGTLGISATEFFNSMKWSLDLRLEEGDNRAPLTIGVHSDTYSAQHTGYDAVATLEERRKAIADFIDYALTKPAVRIVSAKQLIQWMSHPSAL